MTDVLSRFNTAPASDAFSAPLCLDELHPELFRGMHESGEFQGIDMIDLVRREPRPGVSHEVIAAAFRVAVRESGFSYKDFDSLYFDPPVRTDAEGLRYAGGDLDEHAYNVLMAHSGIAADGPTKIGAPNPVTESGGRYSDGRPGHAEWYYWDTLPIVGGLDQLGAYDTASERIDNIRDQIIRFGKPLNGNAPQYLGRSQPAVYSRLVRRDVQLEGPEAYERHLPALLSEYAFLMEGADDPKKLGLTPGSRYKSVARMPDGSILNVFSAERYTHQDGTPRPRPESYPADRATIQEREDMLGRELTIAELTQLCEDLHAGAGAGTDYADWMLGDGVNMATIRTTKRVPPFQNALIFELECTIADGLRTLGDEQGAQAFELKAHTRAKAMNKYLRDPRTGYPMPYDLDTGLVNEPTLQDAAFTLESGIVLPRDVRGIHRTLSTRFMGPGGLRTSLRNTQQSWGGVNVWPLLVLAAARGVHLTGNATLDEAISTTFTGSVHIGLQETGFSFERYHATLPGKRGIRGEYDPPKHNFSWTPAVDAVLRHDGHHNRAEQLAWQRRHRIATGVGRLASLG